MFINTNKKLVQIDDKDKIDISYYDITKIIERYVQLIQKNNVM